MAKPLSLSGRISSIHYDRNYGFISPEDPARRGEEIFFHKEGVLPKEDGTFSSMLAGDSVTYEELFTKKGLRAVHVRKQIWESEEGR